MQVRGPTARLLGLLVGLLLLFASSSSLELEGAPLLEGEGIPEDAPFRWEEPDRLIQKRDVEEAEERAQREKRSEATARCTTCDFSVGRGVSAIDFSQGVEAGFEVPAEVSVNITGNNNNQNFTIELWLRSNNIFYPNRPQYIVSRQPSYGVNDTISDFLTDFAVQLQPNGNLNVFMGGTFRNGFSVDCGFDHFRDTVWHHLAVVVFAPTTEFPIPQVILYVDAEEVCTFGPASRFFGTRNNLNTEPFLFSQYLTNVSGVPSIQTWDGEMDEIRIWNNVRTVDQIKATYLYPLNGNEKGLVAYYTFDETPAGGPEDVWDSGPYEFIGTLIAGPDGTIGAYRGSSIPLKNVVSITNFAPPVPLTFYAWSQNLSDSYVIIVRDTGIPGEFYLDPEGTVRYYPGDSAPTPAYNPINLEYGVPLPQAVLYFVSTSYFSTLAIAEYFIISRNALGNNIFSYDENGYPLFAQILINVTADGCDGHGAALDYCGGCSNGSECPPLGCDGVGGFYDICGVCQPFGSTAPPPCHVGCDGVAFSQVAYDECGVCGGDNACLGCDSVPFSGLVYDDCGVCGGHNSCLGCDGVAFSGVQYDLCGVCGGNDSCVGGCDRNPFSTAVYDACGVCGGGETECVCTVPEWRNNTHQDLDRMILSKDLRDIQHLMRETAEDVEDLLRLLVGLATGTVSCSDFTESILETAHLEDASWGLYTFLNQFQQSLTNVTIPPPIPVRRHHRTHNRTQPPRPPITFDFIN